MSPGPGRTEARGLESRREGLEPPTAGLEIPCSILLSYRRVVRNTRLRKAYRSVQPCRAADCTRWTGPAERTEYGTLRILYS